MELNKIYLGDCIDILQGFQENSIDCCVTSPPYYRLRDYDVEGQIGLESTPEEYITKLVAVFKEVYRVLKPKGTLWINIGDSYAGSMKGAAAYPESAMNCKQGTNRGMLGKAALVNNMAHGFKQKDLIGIPWMLAFALRASGWYLRQDIIWQKSNCMPESVIDRCTRSHEYIFLLSKDRRYYFDNKSIKEPAAGFNNALPAGSTGTDHPNQRRRKGNAKSFRGGGAYTRGQSFRNSNTIERMTHGNSENLTGLRNKRSVWTVATAHNKIAHFATFPEKLIEPCIQAGCPEGGIVLDPFMGAGTTALVARRLKRNYIGIELNQEYLEIAERRIKNHTTL